MSNPEISVIITTYKRKPDMLRRAVKSVLLQSFEDIELIVVDDNVPAQRELLAVKDTVQSFSDERVAYHINERKKGACGARNTGITKARGKYIAFLDDDDEFCSDKLLKMHDALKDPDAGMVVSDFYKKDDESDKIKSVLLKYDEDDIRYGMLCGNHIGASNPLIKKECFDVCGMFDEDMLSAQDLELWCRIAEKYRIKILHECLTIWHVHEGDSITKHPQNKLASNQKLIEKNFDFLKGHPRAHAHLLLIQSKRCIQMHDKKAAFKKYGQALSIYPLYILKKTPLFFAWFIKYRK